MKSKFLETIRVEEGLACNLAYHQKRVDKAFAAFTPRGGFSLQELIDPPKEGLFRCRVVYDVSGADAPEISYVPYEKRVVRSLKIVYDDTLQYDHKYLDRREIDALFAKREGCDDILIVQNGYVKDTSIANIAFFIRGHWITPQEPLLEGTARARFLEEKKIVAEPITQDMLPNVEKTALMNAMIGFDILSGCRFEF